MTAIRPKVRRVRQTQRKLDGGYTRTEVAKGDAHRRKRAIEVKTTGTFHAKGRAPLAHTKRVTAARRRRRGILGRLADIVNREQALVYDELIWGPARPKRYARAPHKPSSLKGLLRDPKGRRA